MNAARLGLIFTCILMPLMEGCARKPDVVDNSVSQNRRLVMATSDDQIALGIVNQRAIYPFHFVAGTAELNELGRRDLTVLADFFVRHPGDLHIRRDQMPQGLYEARVKSVRVFLESRGVQPAQMSFDQGWPGGEGIGAEGAVMRFMNAEAATAKPKETQRGDSFGMFGMGLSKQQ